MEQVTIIPIVLSAIGVVPKNLHKCFETFTSESKYFLNHPKCRQKSMYVCVLSEVING
jgi:hypothetical protein